MLEEFAVWCGRQTRQEARKKYACNAQKHRLRRKEENQKEEISSWVLGRTTEGKVYNKKGRRPMFCRFMGAQKIVPFYPKENQLKNNPKKTVDGSQKEKAKVEDTGHICGQAVTKCELARLTPSVTGNVGRTWRAKETSCLPEKRRAKGLEYSRSASFQTLRLDKSHFTFSGGVCVRPWRESEMLLQWNFPHIHRYTVGAGKKHDPLIPGQDTVMREHGPETPNKLTQLKRSIWKQM